MIGQDSRKTHVGDFLVSSVRGDDEYGFGSLNETCVFYCPNGFTAVDSDSLVVGSYSDHDSVVSAISFAMKCFGQVNASA